MQTKIGTSAQARIEISTAIRDCSTSNLVPTPDVPPSHKCPDQ
jgi:hypothetical protein